MFGDSIIATAILDRLLHHSTRVNIRDESYRREERRKARLLAAIPPVAAPRPAAAWESAAAKQREAALPQALGDFLHAVRNARLPTSNSSARRAPPTEDETVREALTAYYG